MKTQIFIRTGILLLLAGFLFATPIVAFADTCTWDGSDGKWSNAKKWSCGHAPGAADTATIKEGTVRLDSGTIVADLNLKGGTIVSAETLAITVRMNWTGGTLSGKGTTRIAYIATLNIKGNAVKFLGGGHTLKNEGTANWSGGRMDSVQNESATIQNEGTFNLTVPGILYDSDGSGRRVFENHGTLDVTLGTGLLAYANIGWRLNNRGTLNVNSGMLILNAGGTHSETFYAAAGAVLRFVGGTHTLEGVTSLNGDGTFEVTGEATMEVQFIVNGRNFGLDRKGVLTGSGTLRVYGAMTWLNGTMSGSGMTWIAPDATLNITKGDPAYNKFLRGGRTLQNEGTVNWSAGSIYYAEKEPATIKNLGTFNLACDCDLYAVQVTSGTLLFDNGGTLNRTTTKGKASISWPFNNTGTVNIESGTLELDRDGTHTGAFVVASGAFLKFGGGDHTLKAGASLRGGGRFQVYISKLDVASNIGVDGTFLLRSSGVLRGSGTLTIRGTMDWYDGWMDGTGVTEIAPTGTLNIDGKKDLYINDQRTLRNEGTVNWKDGKIQTSPSDSPTISNHGTFNLTCDCELRDPGGPGSPVFNNLSTLKRTTATGTATIGWQFNNSGTVEQQSGTLAFGKTFNQNAGATILNGGAIKFSTPMQLQGGTLSGAGTIKGSVNNSGGAVSPGSSAGMLEITKDYTQGAGGALNIEIGGLTVGKSDQLGIGGNATLGGTLNLSTVGGYTPKVGDTFKIMTLLGTRTGTFATVNGTDLGGGNVFTVNYGASDVTLTVQGVAPITRVSVASDGTQANDSLTSSPVISADGRYVAFFSRASNLVSGDTNGHADVFVHDRLTGETTLVSVPPTGGQIGDSEYPSISGDGRYVAFQALHQGVVGAYYAIFVHDRVTGQTTVISRYRDGSVGSGRYPSISAGGGYVAFETLSGLDPDDTNWPPYYDIYLYERATQQLTWVTRGANRDSYSPHFSADGRYLAFSSDATNLVPNPSGNWQTLVWDRITKQFSLVSVASDGTHANGNAGAWGISDDGRYVVFASNASNLGCGAQYGTDVFVHDRQTGQTTCVSVTPDGTPGYGDSYYASISGDGRYVAFEHDADDLVPGDTNKSGDIFVRDLQTGRTTRASLAHDGAQANGNSWDTSISRDGRYVAFTSGASNLVAGDTNGYQDIFVRDISIVAPPAPTLKSPANGAQLNTLRPTLKWNAVSGANWYTLEAYKDKKTGTPFDQTTTAATKYKTKTLIGGGTKYWWHVQACNDAGCSAWSEWRNFTVTATGAVPEPFE
ncbi:MAG: PD40 domain-containing protein [Chloroflexi bacterium]|nr:PD40 domain-containing protein [Chloroflexota bacterium]